MNKILRRTITVTLTQQQFDALGAAVDDHAQSLADQFDATSAREAGVLAPDEVLCDYWPCDGPLGEVVDRELERWDV